MLPGMIIGLKNTSYVLFMEKLM